MVLVKRMTIHRVQSEGCFIWGGKFDENITEKASQLVECANPEHNIPFAPPLGVLPRNEYVLWLNGTSFP